MLRRDDRVADVGAAAGDHVDDAGREAGRLEQLHDVVGREERRRRGLPQDRVAHQRGRRREVAGDAREVERGDGEDEPFERAVLDLVPLAGRRERLVLVDLPHEVDVVAEEVDQLAGGVDLGLERVLALAEHGGGVERVAPRAFEEVGGAEEDGGAVVPVHPHPVVPGLDGGFDGAVHLGLAALVLDAEDAAVLVRGDDLGRAPGLDALAADHGGDVDRLLAHLHEAGAERGALGAAGGVGADGLVDGDGRGEDGVRHGGVGVVGNHGRGGAQDTGGEALPPTTRGTGREIHRRFNTPGDRPQAVCCDVPLPTVSMMPRTTAYRISRARAVLRAREPPDAGATRRGARRASVWRWSRARPITRTVTLTNGGTEPLDFCVSFDRPLQRAMGMRYG